MMTLIEFTASAPLRPWPGQPGQQQPVTYGIQALAGSFSWGSAPGTASIVYVGATPIGTGAQVAFKLGINWFKGLCKSCVETQGSGAGRTYVVEFVDFREYLTWDWVYGAFNKPDIRLVNGVRIKRYKHLLPENFESWRWTYTDDPMLGSDILAAMMNAATVGTEWSWDLTDRGLFPAGVLSGPCIDLDFTGGRRLDAAINELCAKAGNVVFTLLPKGDDTLDSFHLVFTRKGFLDLGSLPQWLRDEQKDGSALSGNPSKIRVLGERNLYQVMEVPLVPDWARAWEQFLDFSRFVDYIYDHARDPMTGGRFNATLNDPEQYIGRQAAAAYAHEITVRDFVSLVNAQDPAKPTAGEVYADYRKYNFRSRMLMPCKMYFETLVFRAFKPELDSFTNVQGEEVPLDALNLADNLLCRVDHNAQTGTMTYDVTQATDHNGYAIVKGFQIMPELIRMVKSDQFNADFYNTGKRAWGMSSFQIDDSGEGNRFLIFDEPMVVQDDAKPFVVQVDNHVVFNAAAGVAVPPAKAALCFLAEPYSYIKGNGGRVQCENVSGLNAEFVVQNNNYDEVPYTNGETADEQAETIADWLLLRQYFYYEGSRSHVWDQQIPLAEWGTFLTSLVDRVQYRISPTEGVRETVDLTMERRVNAFEPERELDRRTVQNSLFPGQAELRQQAELLRQNAQALRQMPKSVLDLFGKFLRGDLAPDGPVNVVRFKPDSGQTQATPMPMGSIIRRQPLAQASGKNINTTPDYNPVPDGSGNDQRTVFMGVTLAHAVDPAGSFPIQMGGPALAQVQGPVAVNDPLGLSQDGSNNLVVNSDSSSNAQPGSVEAKALEAITDNGVHLIKVRLGGSAAAAAAAGPAVWI